MASTPSIFIATHKAYEMPNHPGYVPLQVGKQTFSIDLGYQGDDAGENISKLNPYFCECTGLYWIAKNCNAEWVGLTHYRRYFKAKNRQINLKGSLIASPEDFDEFDRGAGMIVPEPLGFMNGDLGCPISLESQYTGLHIAQDLFLTREAIEELEPSYLYAFDFTMRNCQLNAYNMFVGRRSIVQAYADWLFPILFILEKRIPYQFYDDVQRRVFGYIAERLFTVWISKNRGNYKIVTRDTITLP